MRKLELATLTVVLAVLPAIWTPARGQGAIQPQVLYARQRQIVIPFDPDPTQAHRLKQLQLHYSTDQGRTWHLGATAAPDQKKFTFLAEGDGFYLFAVQTTDQNGRNFPEKMEGVTAGLRVVIDTIAPIVTLRPLPPRGNEVGVTWDIRDDNPDVNAPDAIQLEYRALGGLTWLPLARIPGAIQHYWVPATPGPMEVKLKARDLAGNSTEASTQVSLTGSSGFGIGSGANQSAGIQSGPLGVPLDPSRRFINNKRITLNYKITEEGPSGISSIDLWFTTDGRSWSKYQLPKASPLETGRNVPLTFEAQSEGVYGFSLVPKSGVGISGPPPQVNEKPQVWVEVDLTKPVVQLDKVMVGTGTYKGQVSVAWTARDKNFGANPIALSYSPAAEGPWVPIQKALPNTGNFIWTIPQGGSVPWQFFIKVEAVDLAGNIGEAVTPGLVKVDTLQPKATILDITGGVH